jgi:hypothetical protein
MLGREGKSLGSEKGYLYLVQPTEYLGTDVFKVVHVGNQIKDL